MKNLLTFFLTVSEGTITSTNSCRQPVKDENGIIKLGAMKLENANYSYPRSFDIEKEISKTLKGSIYKRGLDDI